MCGFFAICKYNVNHFHVSNPKYRFLSYFENFIAQVWKTTCEDKKKKQTNFHSF